MDAAPKRPIRCAAVVVENNIKESENATTKTVEPTTGSRRVRHDAEIAHDCAYNCGRRSGCVAEKR